MTPTFSGTAGTASGDDLTDVTVKVYSGATTGGTLLETLHADPDDGTGAYSVHASPALAQGTYTARAQQVDAVGNTGFSTANTFKVDTTAPTSTISFPADGGAYNASSYQAGCSTPSTDDLCGTSTDTGGSTVASVDVSVERNSDSMYWDPNAVGTDKFTSASEVFMSAT